MTPPDDTHLEALLREGLGRPPLRDGGFTARVLDSMARRGAFPNCRIMVALGWIGAAVGLSVALWAECSRLGTGSTAGVFCCAWLGFAFVATLMSCLAAWHAIYSAPEG